MKRNSKSDKVFQNAIEKIENHRRTPGESFSGFVERMVGDNQLVWDNIALRGPQNVTAGDFLNSFKDKKSLCAALRRPLPQHLALGVQPHGQAGMPGRSQHADLFDPLL